MLKTVKLHDEAYKAAKRLTKELEKEKAADGIYKVNLTNAISFAINRALDEIERKRRFRAAAGAWGEAAADKMRKIIHENRRFRTKEFGF